MALDWTPYVKTNPQYNGLKNKNTEAIFVTEDNCNEFLEFCNIFERWREDSDVVCTGFMSLRRLPFWVAKVNPRGKKKYYKIIDDVVFQKNFEEKK